ncbi:MAG: hypothetical protein JSS72_00860 [Armatimonadetes bacterium]|nr:hypothetical protein [Armatimonadota bacterium]
MGRFVKEVSTFCLGMLGVFLSILGVSYLLIPRLGSGWVTPFATLIVGAIMLAVAVIIAWRYQPPK